jgi:hypothetical protein
MNSVFQYIMPFSLLKVNWHFGWIYHLHRQELKVSSKLMSLLPVSYWFHAWFTRQPWTWRRHVPPKYQLTFSGLHGITSPKIHLLKHKKVCWLCCRRCFRFFLLFPFLCSHCTKCIKWMHSSDFISDHMSTCCNLWKFSTCI